jgi:hypothetical protein
MFRFLPSLSVTHSSAASKQNTSASSAKTEASRKVKNRVIIFKFYH